MNTVLIIGNGRLDCLHRTVKSVYDYLPRMDAYLMVDDSGIPEIAAQIADTYPQFQLVSHPDNVGMARAVQSGFDLVLSTQADTVFWVEEDMLLTNEIPITRAVQILDEHPEVAQILFRRQPLNPTEQALGCVLAGIVYAANTYKVEEDYTTHDAIFSLNPCVIPRWVLEYGWPAGPIGVGNETGMTNRLLDAGFVFGVWGEPLDGQQHVEHIGNHRGRNWQL